MDTKSLKNDFKVGNFIRCNCCNKTCKVKGIITEVRSDSYRVSVLEKDYIEFIAKKDAAEVSRLEKVLK